MSIFSVEALFQEVQDRHDLVFEQRATPIDSGIQTFYLEFAQKLSQSHLLESCVLLPGDASTRRYYRMTFESQSWILMKMEDFSEQGSRLPFLELQSYFQSKDLSVPQVFAKDAGRGLILLEDLGDVTLLRKLCEVKSEREEEILYQEILNELILFQNQTLPSSEKSSKSVVAHSITFNFEKLFWEVNHTLEHFFRIYLKRHLKQRDEARLRDVFSEICLFLEKSPQVLVHRDFHSRNLMESTDSRTGKSRWVFIDFQDARMGPWTYDLVSLLRDSYYDLSEVQVERLLDYYWTHSELKKTMSRDFFEEEFEQMTLQRCFKVIGSFASFFNRRGDPSYLKFIGNTFHTLRRVTKKKEKYALVNSILLEYYSF